MQSLHTDRDIEEEFRIMFERPIAYHSYFAYWFGVCAAVFLSQALYWSKIKNSEGGWFYKTREDWKYETGLTRDEQETSRKKLVKFGVLEEKLAGNPARMYYRVTLQPFATLFRQLLDKEKANPVGGKAPNKMVEKHPAKIAENPPTLYTENTTENTTIDEKTYNNNTDTEFNSWMEAKREKKEKKLRPGGFIPVKNPRSLSGSGFKTRSAAHGEGVV